MTTTLDNTATIRELNDQCRQAWGVYPNTRVVSTGGIMALTVEDRSAIYEKVQSFDSFTDDNDPHGEHDFGSIDHKGERIFWKIDYYDRACEFGSEDPADPTKTTRVLTIMLAEEY
jgi:hypothetical protein